MADAIELSRPDERTHVYVWEQMTEADEGTAVRISPGFARKTLLATGTFNGGSYALECSVDGVSFVSAVDAQGDPIVLTAAGAVVVGSNGLYWRVANDNMGTAEDADVHLLCTLG